MRPFIPFLPITYPHLTVPGPIIAGTCPYSREYWSNEVNRPGGCVTGNCLLIYHGSLISVKKYLQLQCSFSYLENIFQLIQWVCPWKFIKTCGFWTAYTLDNFGVDCDEYFFGKTSLSSQRAESLLQLLIIMADLLSWKSTWLINGVMNFQGNHSLYNYAATKRGLNGIHLRNVFMY